MISRVNHIGIVVEDFDRMLEFYQLAFGFEIAKMRDPTNAVSNAAFGTEARPGPVPRMAMLRAGNCFLEVIENFDRDTTPTPKRGYVHLAFEVSNIDDAFSRLRGMGVEFDHPAPIDLGYVKVARAIDPEGNQIELDQNMPHSEYNLSALQRQ
ncbi:MAG: VOC family protein [Novosphingobium sp.]|nr:VOC family protein [Novosphingobium sp.]